MITVFTFAFSSTNLWALGNHLGVAPWAAPLVAPAVDLSIAGLLLAVHHLSVHDATAALVRRLRTCRSSRPSASAVSTRLSRRSSVGPVLDLRVCGQPMV
ncbi:DUF2637 domain-containing protein [Actinomadura rudentiformis]|uniref:DUF2637 domain-containing protein n=1 Tax=Actinomadura rudentiformis TaxID=359158 RepID=UPI00178C393F|nr:DUF2637 domain-containing protein [Actinomadura rudentiformis]